MVIEVFYICVSFWLLADETRDFSQVEQINFFHSKWSGFDKNKSSFCEFAQLLTSIIFVSA